MAERMTQAQALLAVLAGGMRKERRYWKLESLTSMLYPNRVNEQFQMGTPSIGFATNDTALGFETEIFSISASIEIEFRELVINAGVSETFALLPSVDIYFKEVVIRKHLDDIVNAQIEIVFKRNQAIYARKDEPLQMAISVVFERNPA
ncbi:hypothetical protein [Shewanella sp. Iso12]|uniref:hypothetical protein n=1 Tax=Shewanella sp. Iso12 TaxID=1826753 RepID=UPI0014302107|nr:hypothetical protein [Shewanella sp. Iso12]NJI84808.1 hypothetical protein [Shewanella sp. Iso12]